LAEQEDGFGVENNSSIADNQKEHYESQDDPKMRIESFITNKTEKRQSPTPPTGKTFT
jgi:hypothetical protein